LKPRTETPASQFVASVVIPAHNEASVIGRLLGSLPSQTGRGRVQVVVACNGCTDNTADVARSFGATVVEVKTSSKIAALNAADDVAVAYPRLYIDADIIVTARTIIDLIEALSVGDILCAAPPSRMELAGRPWTVRAYFRVWKSVMVARDGYVGSGVYAVSMKGRERFGRFPNIIADDLFVRNVFARAERRVISTEPTVVEAPRTLRALLRRRIRVCLGNSQLSTHAEYRSLPGNVEPSSPWWRAVLANPALIPASFVYASVNSLARIAAYRNRSGGRPVEWARDDSTRPDYQRPDTKGR
jgi:glycosyltransferase involved in cell wall biosynthesis